MKKLVYIIVFFIAINAFSQGEANNWYFGQNAGLDFNSGSPVALTNGQLNTVEGCASISNSDGDLLFYTDGTNVYNNTHTRMSNGFGLNGNPSSSQSAIIVPNPEDINIYYIFTVEDQNGEGRGLQYSVVDISLNDVTVRNTPLVNDTAEKITAVKSDDCNSYWVITYKLGRFYVYKVDVNGVNESPIAGNNGFYVNSDNRGYLKVSPDGTKIAIAHQGDVKLLIYDFDDATGIISNEIGIPLNSPNNKPYGVEFSPSGKRLYVHASNDYWNQGDPSQNNIPTNHTSTLYQIDLENTDVTSAAARTILDNRNLYRGALQLAPDGKIYRALSSTYNIGLSKLGVINNPEELGVLSNYQHEAIDLGGRLSTQGLPPFITSYLLPIEITDNISPYNINKQEVKLCQGDDYQLFAEIIEGDPTYNWIYNNAIISTEPNLSLYDLTINDSGIYYLEVEVIDKCDFQILYKGEVTLVVNNPPTIIPNIVYTQCDFDTDTIDGITSFNLSTKEDELTNNISNLEVSFYEVDDIAMISPIDKSEYRNSNNPFNHSLLVKVENIKTGCSSVETIDLSVLQTSLDSYPDVYTCEIDNNENDTNAIKSEGNGLGTFDFNEISNTIKSIFQTPVLVEIYHNSNDALLQINQINGIQDFEPQEVFVRIENETTNSCEGGGTLNLNINQLPEPNGSEDPETLCVSNPRDNPQLFTVLLNGETGNVDDTYQWFFNGNIISGAINSTYDANAEGVYKVEATHQNLNDPTNTLDDSFCTGFNTFKVIESNIALITFDDITIIDDSINNSISINNSNNNLGIGDYEFSLVDINGNIEYPYSDQPFFENVPAGIHTIYINDKKFCGTTSIDVSVVGYPKFFTPNNDGYNDTWKVLGVDENFYAASLIYIFDRFGKLVTIVDPKNEGWNGTFNGKILPSSDYWFSVQLIDSEGNIREKRGHFSLIRK